MASLVSLKDRFDIAFGNDPASAARKATVWSTDKDGIILSLLAAEITARTGKTLASTTRK